MAIVAGSSDNIYAVDADLGKMLWKRHFHYSSDKPQIQNSSWLCPGGLTATPVITPMGVRRRSSLAALSPVPGPPPSAGGGTTAAPARRTAPAGGGPLASGRSMLFQPMECSSAQRRERRGVDGSGEIYASEWKTLQPEHGYDVTTPRQHRAAAVTQTVCIRLIWRALQEGHFPSFERWRHLGLGGAPIGTDGTVYVEVGDGPWDPADGKYSDTVLALSPKDLKIKDYYTPSNREWITKRDLDMNDTPVVSPI